MLSVCVLQDDALGRPYREGTGEGSAAGHRRPTNEGSKLNIFNLLDRTTNLVI